MYTFIFSLLKKNYGIWLKMKINYAEINPSLSINKQQIRNAISPETFKLDTEGFHSVIQPLIPVNIAKNLILQNARLDKCIRILAQDVILNEFTFLSENTNDDDQHEKVLNFWKNNVDELNKQAQEYYSYGFGASEVIFDETGFPVKLYQIPSETLFISQENHYGEFGQFDGYSYYAVQKVGAESVKMRLSRFQYDEQDQDLPVCFWWGKGRTSEFYEIPYWLPAFNSIAAKVALDGLNAKKINEGNLLSGILTIVAPPLKKGEVSAEDTLKSKMDDAGIGTFVLNLTQYDEDMPLDVKYIPITESNYDYLLQISESCDDDILACYSIPKIRMMNASEKESMNSNKSDVIYEVYTKSLENEQMPFEKEINKFNRKYFDYDGIVNIGVPIFADKKETEVKSILSLFDKGILTLGETIKAIMPYYPDLNININENNPLFKERYYNGRILGFNTGNVNSIGFTGDVDELIKQFQEL